jgi:hypothetical protein
VSGEPTGVHASTNTQLIAATSGGSREQMARPVTCSSCGARYEGEAWAKLALSRRIERPELCLLARDWPADTCVEVRSCSVCARLIPAKRHRVGTPVAEEMGAATLSQRQASRRARLGRSMRL